MRTSWDPSDLVVGPLDPRHQVSPRARNPSGNHSAWAWGLWALFFVGALHHPNIVAIHDVGIHEGRPFLVMDFIDGPSLEKLARENPLPAPRAARYARGIAEAIHFAHERGILHRDLKPLNILVGPDDEPRVTDFGLARRLDVESSLTQTGQALGSPHYMPPEQAPPCPSAATRASDVYGLGGVLYFLLTGHAPFEGASVTEVLERVRTEDPVPPGLVHPGVPPELQALCLKCLAKEPTRRFASARELADELGRFLSGDPVVTQSPFDTVFTKLHWAEPEFAEYYAEQADVIIPVRRYCFHLLTSFLARFHRSGPAHLCDLGCGDGALAEHIAKASRNSRLTLVDGSEEMLDRARRRLGKRPNLRFVQATFDAIIGGESILGPFDFVVSSFAIHHLNASERTALFFRAFQQLHPGGWFLNLDVGLPVNEVLAEWQFEVWRELLLDRERKEHGTDQLRDLPERVRGDPDNHFSSLTQQQNALRSVGFVEVDCLYRHSIFTLYCGRKPEKDRASGAP